MATIVAGLDLAQHLRSLGAPRAAHRLAGGVAPAAVEAFAVDEGAVRLVADESGAADFAAALRGAETLAFDSEWRPDGPDDDHAPSLARAAVSAASTRVEARDLSRPTG